MGLKIPGFIIVWVRLPLPAFVTIKVNKKEVRNGRENKRTEIGRSRQED